MEKIIKDIARLVLKEELKYLDSKVQELKSINYELYMMSSKEIDAVVQILDKETAPVLWEKFFSEINPNILRLENRGCSRKSTKIKSFTIEKIGEITND